MIANRTAHVALDVLKDAEGNVTLGWVGERVFYARLAGTLSADLGRLHVARLREVLAGVTSMLYFFDARALDQHDLLARSAFTRLVLEHRRKFATLVMLTKSEGVTPGLRAFVAAIGESVTVVTDPAVFEKLLVAAAPLAQQRIDARAWVNDSPAGIARR